LLISGEKKARVISGKPQEVAKMVVDSYSAKVELVEKAIKEYKLGNSIYEIMKQLEVDKNSVFFWQVNALHYLQRKMLKRIERYNYSMDSVFRARELVNSASTTELQLQQKVEYLVDKDIDIFDY